MRLIVLVAMVAVLMVAIVAVLEAVQAVQGVWLAMDTAIVVHIVMDVMMNWLVDFHVMKALVVQFHLENVNLNVIYVLVVAMIAIL